MNLDGFILPPEWDRHEATWLSWPVNQETWPKHILRDMLPQYLAFVSELSQVEKVRINLDHSRKDSVFNLLDKTPNVRIGNVEFFDHPTNDSWIRDYGPDFLVNERDKLVLNWGYNSWGEKYPPFNLDNDIPNKVAEALDISQVDVSMILEGGSFDVNGEGVLITTASCLLNSNRNPQLSKSQIEFLLKKYLRQKEIIWLFEGIRGDDTDGHIDDITRFVNSDTLLTATCTQADQNYEVLTKNKKYLVDNFSNRFKIIDLPMPKPLVVDNIEVPASYANFYIANDKVIVPIFNDSNDKEAMTIIESCFPDRNVVGLDSSKIIYGLGSFHCLSKQEPKVL